MPDASVTVHVTVVVPTVKTAGASFVTEITEQLSFVKGVPRLTLKAAHELFALTVTFAGAVMVGLITSVTVTVCVAVVMFPFTSVTVHVTVVVPIG